MVAVGSDPEEARTTTHDASLDGDTIVMETAPSASAHDLSKGTDDVDGEDQTVRQAIDPDVQESLPNTHPSPPMERTPPSRLSVVPITMPRSVQILEMAEENDPLEETEVRTLVTNLGFAPPPASVSSAAPAPTIVVEADAADDSVTERAPPVDVERLTALHAKTSALARFVPVPAAGRPPDGDYFAIPRHAEGPGSDVYDAEESVTTRGPPVRRKYAVDRITVEASLVRPKRVETITTEAPGHLTNMLRVIASPSAPAFDEEPSENPIAAERVSTAHVEALLTVSGVPASTRTEQEQERSLAADAARVENTRYVRLLAVFAAVALAVPLLVFLWLKQKDAAMPVRSPSELANDPVRRDDLVRTRAPKDGSAGGWGPGAIPSSHVAGSSRGRDPLPRRK